MKLTLLKKRVTLLSLLFLFASETTLFCDEANITVIESLVSSVRNKTFQTFMQQVEKNYMETARGNKKLPVQFYSYTVQKGETLFTISARCNILYDTIASLNHISSASESIEGKTLIIPTATGLFIPAEPVSDIEILLSQQYYPQDNDIWYTINGEQFRFLPNERFESTQRAFFLDSSLRMPLEKSVLTSPFGMRTSPISGEFSFHKGVDLAAPIGTQVFACKAGTVESAVHNDRIFGNYIIIDHGGQMRSVYAHLSEIQVEKGMLVSGGSRIGLVGTTGASTGPHLHFEIRINGQAQDPGRLIRNLY